MERKKKWTLQIAKDRDIIVRKTTKVESRKGNHKFHTSHTWGGSKLLPSPKKFMLLGRYSINKR
jgi:hypothetical protein